MKNVLELIKILYFEILIDSFEWLAGEPKIRDPLEMLHPSTFGKLLDSFRNLNQTEQNAIIKSLKDRGDNK